MRRPYGVSGTRTLPPLFAFAVMLLTTVTGAATEQLPGEATLQVLADSPDEIVVRYEPPEPAPGAAPGAGWSTATLVRVPDRGRVTARCEPEGRATVSDPGIMRDIRVVRVAFDIPADDPRPVTVTLAIDGTPGLNERAAGTRPPSPAFESLYRHAVANYKPSEASPTALSPAGRDEIPFGGRYLIITTPALATQIQPLADWKHLKGVQTKLVTLNDTGSSALSIRNYIQNAYDTWTVPPEYVLLVGDTEALPTYISETWTDDYYATLEGSDYFVDVMVGRISADTQAQCATQVAKILCYERTPLQGDPNWPASALLTVADDYNSGDAIYYMNTWFIYDLLEPAGFSPIDTLFNRNDVTPTQVYNSWNLGRGFYNFRGLGWTEWPWPFDINPSSLANGGKPTVVISATCGTGSFHQDGFICENILRAGSPTNTIGAVAFFGSNTVIESSPALSRRRGAGDMGFYEHAFSPGGGTLGAACVAAKTAIYLFDQVRQEYEAWNLLGDPDMQLWTGPPQAMQVSHDDYYYAGQGSFVVTVLSSGQPLEGALVGCVKGSDVYAWGYTGADGHASFTPNPTSAGTMAVTVTALNHYPYEGTVSVLDTGPFLICSDVAIDDSEGGNGDGLLSPGESADLSILLTNVGDMDALAVTGTLRTTDPLAAIPDSVASYGTVPQGGSAWSVPPYGISASAECPVGHLVDLDLEVAFGATTLALSPPPIAIATADMNLVSASVDDAPPGGDGGGDASPGETIGIVAVLENVGLLGVSDVDAELVSLSPYATVTTAQAPLGLVAAGATVSNSATPFVLAVSPGAPDGHVITLRIDLTGTGDSYAYSESLTFTLTVAGTAYSLVSGPDQYGYHAYDSGDTLYTVAPAFEWYDISQPGVGTLITAITDADAGVTTVNMPFGFRYYGVQYLQLSVCSNGFLSMGTEDYRYGDNSVIPSIHGPDRMIAPFWDDLDPSASGDIYKWYDATNHRFIIQFDEVPRWGTTDAQTFQVVFLHPTYYPTPTTDGQILFLYETVSAPTSCTVGIESADQTDGIGYLFDGTYDSHAAPLSNGRAVLFTTIVPVEPDLPWLTLSSLDVDDTAGNGNGVADPGETFTVTLGLANSGDIAATGVTGVLTTEEPSVTVLDAAGSFPDIPVGGSGSNASDRFTLRLSDAATDTVVTLWALIESNDGGYSAPVRCELHVGPPATGVPDQPVSFAILNASPNPFTEATTLALALPEPSAVTVSVYSPSGRLVRQLDHGTLPAGWHLLSWDGRDEHGRPTASGVYFLRVQAGERKVDRKAVLLR